MSQVISDNIWNILAVATYLIVGVGVIYTIKGDVKALGLSTQLSLEAAMRRLQSVEGEVIELRKVVVSLARQEERQNATAAQINAMDQRQILFGKRVDEAVERMNRFIDKQAISA